MVPGVFFELLSVVVSGNAEGMLFCFVAKLSLELELFSKESSWVGFGDCSSLFDWFNFGSIDYSNIVMYYIIKYSTVAK